jgi:hypothetical protein
LNTSFFSDLACGVFLSVGATVALFVGALVDRAVVDIFFIVGARVAFFVGALVDRAVVDIFLIVGARVA